jgi:IS30 family transposase
MSYRHLTLEQRYQIAALQRAGLNQQALARVLGRHPSTISRELRRNPTGKVYVGSIAHGQAKRRRHLASARPHLAEALRKELWNGLLARHSPEQIRGRLALLRIGQVSLPTIYRCARRWGLHQKLRHPHRYRRRGRAPARFADRRSIHTRPAVVDQRQRIGDWEADTVHPSRGRGALITLVERRTGLARIGWCLSTSALAVALCIGELLRKLAHPVYTLTCDRGTEFARDRWLEHTLHTKVYFADPHSPWQRGGNENFNGLLRQYFPRTRDFSTITAQELWCVENELNQRPRKRLGFLTPNEVFFDLNPVALQS